MTMFIAVCAIIVIGIVVAVVMDRIMRTRDTRTHNTQNDGGCWGCKYLDFWNDGSPLCTKSIDGVCIPNGFKYREREDNH